MGIKMSAAFDQNNKKWEASNYQKGLGAEPLHCEYCKIPVTHNPPHTREMHDKSVFVQGYFRLLPKGIHTPLCPYGVDEEIKNLAMTSEGLVESLLNNRFRMRLVMIKEAIEALSSSDFSRPNAQGIARSKSFVSRPNRLPAYINSARRVLKLRSLCASDQDIEQHLELVFEGNVKISWSQFYYETERHLDAFNAITRNTIQHPLAIHGQVSTVRLAINGDPSKNVINLRMNRYKPDPNDDTHGVGLEVSIWIPDQNWLRSIKEDDRIIALGMWKSKTAAPRPAAKEGRFKNFTMLKLYLNIALAAQIIESPA